ncbi:hypothetical protein [Micromonospora tarapacensis]|uniref:hypothetical protein n=1 Tax=Micromonospora tarapacensis TaxID=2835305 RepID=UPI0038B294CA
MTANIVLTPGSDEARSAVAEALREYPGVTARKLAGTANLPLPVVTEALTAMEAAGTATRTSDLAKGNRKSADTWEATTGPSADDEPTPTGDTPATGPATGTADDGATTDATPDAADEPTADHDGPATADEPTAEDTLRPTRTRPTARPARTRRRTRPTRRPCPRPRCPAHPCPGHRSARVSPTSKF